MFERSEFSRRFEPREAQGTAVAAGRSGTRPGEKPFDSHRWCSPFGPASPFAPLCGAVAQAKKSDSLAAASETKAMQQIVPSAFVASWIRIDHKQVPRLRLGMTVVSRIIVTR